MSSSGILLAMIGLVGFDDTLRMVGRGRKGLAERDDGYVLSGFLGSLVMRVIGEPNIDVMWPADRGFTGRAGLKNG